jgi:hypothetical protein
MATAAPPGQEEARAELEGLAVKPGLPRLLFLLIRFRSRARSSSNASTLLAAQARRKYLRHSSIKLATKPVHPVCMITLFARDESGRRACFGQYKKFQKDPHWPRRRFPIAVAGAPGFWNAPKFPPRRQLPVRPTARQPHSGSHFAHLPGKSSVQRSNRRIALHRTTATPTAIHAHCGKGHDGSHPPGCQQTHGHTLSRRDGQNCHPHGYMPFSGARKAKHDCIKFGNFEPHFWLRSDMARGSPGMKLMRLPWQFRVQFRPL